MKKMNSLSIFRLTMIAIVLSVAFGCQNNNNSTPNNFPALSTTSASDVTHSSAISGGNISSDGGSSVLARGVCWSTQQNPTITDDLSSDGAGIGTFTSNITGLQTNTTYFAKAYATNINGTSYGNQITFATSAVPSNSFTATIDGVPFVATGVTSSIVFDILGVTGFWGGQQILLFMPEDIIPGTYTLSEVGDYYAQYMPNSSNPYPAVSGQLTITEYNLAAKKVKGSFSMEVIINSNNISITNGQFEVYNIYDLM